MEIKESLSPNFTKGRKGRKILANTLLPWNYTAI